MKRVRFVANPPLWGSEDWNRVRYETDEELWSELESLSNAGNWSAFGELFYTHRKTDRIRRLT